MLRPGTIRKIIISRDPTHPQKSSKNHVEKTLLREFCRYFRAEISHGDPERDFFFWKIDRPKNTHFFKKSTPYVAPAQSTRTKMTANGFSSYELFVKKCDFCCILQ